MSYTAQMRNTHVSLDTLHDCHAASLNMANPFPTEHSGIGTYIANTLSGSAPLTDTHRRKMANIFFSIIMILAYYDISWNKQSKQCLALMI